MHLRIPTASARQNLSFCSLRLGLSQVKPLELSPMVLRMMSWDFIVDSFPNLKLLILTPFIMDLCFNFATSIAFLAPDEWVPWTVNELALVNRTVQLWNGFSIAQHLPLVTVVSEDHPSYVRRVGLCHELLDNIFILLLLIYFRMPVFHGNEDEDDYRFDIAYVSQWDPSHAGPFCDLERLKEKLQYSSTGNKDLRIKMRVRNVGARVSTVPTIWLPYYTDVSKLLA